MMNEWMNFQVQLTFCPLRRLLVMIVALNFLLLSFHQFFLDVDGPGPESLCELNVIQLCRCDSQREHDPWNGQMTLRARVFCIMELQGVNKSKTVEAFLWKQVEKNHWNNWIFVVEKEKWHWKQKKDVVWRYLGKQREKIEKVVRICCKNHCHFFQCVVYTEPPWTLLFLSKLLISVKHFTEF